MPIITVTNADIQKSKVLDAGWYKAKIQKISELTKSKDGGSANINVDFLIEDHDGKEVPHTFNSKGWILLPQLYQAIFGVEMDAQSFDFSTMLNKQVDVDLFIDNYNGRLSNKIRGFLTYGKGGNAPAF